MRAKFDFGFSLLELTNGTRKLIISFLEIAQHYFHHDWERIIRFFDLKEYLDYSETKDDERTIGIDVFEGLSLGFSTQDIKFFEKRSSKHAFRGGKPTIAFGRYITLKKDLTVINDQFIENRLKNLLYLKYGPPKPFFSKIRSKKKS